VSSSLSITHEIAVERSRQKLVEGFTYEHDDKTNDDGQLIDAAICYAAPIWAKEYWPWAPKWWKPRDNRRNLIRAAALIVAEIERLDRLATVKS
jgi:hypothetical protein